MNQTKIKKITGTAKGITDSAVFAYVAIVAVKGLSELAKDFWTWKTQTKVSGNK